MQPMICSTMPPRTKLRGQGEKGHEIERHQGPPYLHECEHGQNQILGFDVHVMSTGTLFESMHDHVITYLGVAVDKSRRKVPVCGKLQLTNVPMEEFYLLH